MKSRTHTSAFVLAILIAAAWQPAYADLIVDDFESYQNGRIVGPSAVSSPWRRFGAATNDNVVATQHEKWVINGLASALYGLAWPNPFGAVRRAFDQPTALDRYLAATVNMYSDRNDSGTLVRLAISNGPTTYVTAHEHRLSTRSEQLVFSLGRNKMIRVAGADSYAAVIRGVWNIGFNFRSPEGEGYETIVFDDFVLHESLLPNPDGKTDKVSVAD